MGKSLQRVPTCKTYNPRRKQGTEITNGFLSPALHPRSIIKHKGKITFHQHKPSLVEVGICVLNLFGCGLYSHYYKYFLSQCTLKKHQPLSLLSSLFTVGIYKWILCPPSIRQDTAAQVACLINHWVKAGNKFAPWGTGDQSVPPQCLERSWSTSSWKLC